MHMKRIIFLIPLCVFVNSFFSSCGNRTATKKNNDSINRIVTIDTTADSVADSIAMPPMLDL